MNVRVVIVAAAIGLLCAGLVAFHFAGSLFAGGPGFSGPPATPVETITAKPGTWLPGIDAVGTARAVQGADIATQVTGTIRSVRFKANDCVKAGDLLVQIDDSVERADMASADANVRLYDAQIARASALRAKGFVSQASLDTTQAQLGIARSARARAKALIDYKAIRAPFAGTVGIARVDAGQYVNDGTILVTLQDLDHIKVDFTVPEQIAGQLKEDQPVRFGDDRTKLQFRGRLVGIDPKADPASRLVAVQALVDNANGTMRPGQFVAVRVELPGEANVLALPQTAVMTSLYGDFVFVVGPPETRPPSEGDAKSQPPAAPPAALVAKQVFVTTGRRDGQRVEIVKGLKAGDAVVAAGQNRLQNNAPVTIAEPFSASAPATAEPGK
ncbi:MAG: efflux RND transporter periplasmic adaptor subunit [Micropepsaceae bacterium]